MLLPDQVLPFVRHPDSRVRILAVGYLGEAHDRGAATQDDLWDALDRYRPLPRQLRKKEDLRELSWFMRWLHAFAPTEGSTRRLFHELRSERDPRLRKDMIRAATELPVDAKLRLLADPSITDELDADVVLGLRDDVWLAGQSFEELWAALEECAAGLGPAGTIESPLFRRAVCVVRALAAHPERAGERALAILRGPAPAGDVASWQETFSVLIFERVPMPAFDARLLDILGQDGDLYLNERASDALVRQGTPEVVAAVEERIPGGTSAFQIYGRGVLGQIKIPESEAACLRLLRRSARLQERTEYASCLYHLCASTPEALGAIAGMVLAGLYDAELISLDEALLTLGTMVGWAPDEAAWEARPRPDRNDGELHQAFWKAIEALRRRPPGPLPPLRDDSVPYGARPRRKRASR
jgi:hypothetical protein